MLRLLSIFLCMVAFEAQAQVVVSIKPLHSLVAGVMEGSGQEPFLLVDGAQSLHSFSLKPSQAIALKNAKRIFYLSDEMETFLAKYSHSLAASMLEKTQGLTFYKARNSDHDDEHEEHVHHEHSHEHSSHDGKDFHFWLSVANARVMVQEIARVLSKDMPQQASLFASNAQALDAKLAALDISLKDRMQPLQHKAFATFHDATQYFDRTYGLQYAGSLTLHPEQGLSAGRVQKLRQRMLHMNAVCIFHEPQFDPAVVQSLVKGTNIKTLSIDPEAALIQAGAGLYFQMMERLTAAIENCLS